MRAIITIKPIDAARWPRSQWHAQRKADQQRVQPWVEQRIERMSRQQKHPVYDFLFEYYAFRTSHLMRWSPGIGIVLEGATFADVGWHEFDACEDGVVLRAASFPSHRQHFLKWAIDYLEAIQQREPAFQCLGLHEWAMIYRDPAQRHAQFSLRVTRAELDTLVESHSLRCTHFDAFRFFSEAAVPRNRIALTRAETILHDQAGCIHVNMDLYKFAYLIAPYCSSALLADAFDLARSAREVDMRASPYDLAALGFEPLKIETREGCEHYIELQRRVAQSAQPIRERLLGVYHLLHAAVIEQMESPAS